MKLIFNSIWRGFFDPLFDPGVGDKTGPLPTLFFQITSSISMKLCMKIACHLEILKSRDMGSSYAHDHRDDVISYPEQTGFAEEHLFPEKQVII